MAFVFGLTAASNISDLTLCLAISISINTGIALNWIIGFTVVGNLPPK